MQNKLCKVRNSQIHGRGVDWHLIELHDASLRHIDLLVQHPPESLQLAFGAGVVATAAIAYFMACYKGKGRGGSTAPSDEGETGGLAREA